MKVERLSAVRTDRLCLLPPHPGDSPVAPFCWKLSRPQGHSAAGRIKSVKDSSDPVVKFISVETVQREH